MEPEGVMEQEQAYLLIIGAMERYSIKNDILTNAAAANEANGIAQREGAFVSDVTITDVDASAPIGVNGYRFFGKEHGKFRNFTFTVVS